MTERNSFEQGSPIIQSTHRTRQPGMWDDDPASAQAPPPYRIARASLPVQEHVVVSSTRHTGERPGTTLGPPTPSIPRINPTSPMSAVIWCPLGCLPALPRPLTKGSTIARHTRAPAAIVAA